MNIYVGTCGFCESIKSYFTDYDTIEIQNTFYTFPKEDTLKKWKKLSRPNFVFNFKVFQGITHPITSPTWKRSGLDISKLKDKVGFFKPTKIVFSFWNKMIEYQKLLDAKLLLIQLPQSFKPTEENLSNLENFFENITRGNFYIGLELRGWPKNLVKKVCKEFDLVDVTDPFLRDTTTTGLIYYRLHGSYENGRINYRHKYTDEELTYLYKNVKKKKGEIFLLFNNVFMKEDSKEMKRLIG